MIEPLTISVELECDADHAFAVWAERFGLWWPPSHTMCGPGGSVHFEPELGGRIYERGGDGTEHEWGEITRWDPPTSVAYLWHLRRDRADATDVELRFSPAGPGRSRLDITHTGWERLGRDGPSWRDANHGGWSGLLPHFLAACVPDNHSEP